jgi:hypothetical protein
MDEDFVMDLKSLFSIGWLKIFLVPGIGTKSSNFLHQNIQKEGGRGRREVIEKIANRGTMSQTV